MTLQTILLYILPAMIILCIAACWFFANSEMAMLSSNRLKLKSAAKSGDKRANIILALLNNPAMSETVMNDVIDAFAIYVPKN